MNNEYLAPLKGITILYDPTERALENAENACSRMLKSFPWLSYRKVMHGKSVILSWFSSVVKIPVYMSDDGSLFVFAGSPSAPIPQESLLTADNSMMSRLWEGRGILVKIGSSGERWDVWNDWCASLPGFYSAKVSGQVLSTLEPVAVASLGLGESDVSKGGLIELLLNGHFLGVNTLYEGLNVLKPDCHSVFERGNLKKETYQATVSASDRSYGLGLDQMIDGLKQRLTSAVSASMNVSRSWNLPLSGGMDSRIIASSCSSGGYDMSCLTYGPKRWCETVYAKRVAKKLKLPWRNIQTGDSFLTDNTRGWLECFGSSMHAHGMYQAPLLNELNHSRPIITGFVGDPLGGLQIKSMDAVHRNTGKLLPLLLSKMRRCKEEDLPGLVNFDPIPYIEEQEAELQSQYSALDGLDWHKRWFLFHNNHVARFSYYQPQMYDYWSSVATPYMDREYANFCLSLPRAVLEDRMLQCKVLEKYWPAAASVASTAFSEPLLPSGISELKRRLLWKLPDRFAEKLRVDETVGWQAIRKQAILKSGINALFPMNKDSLSSGFLRVDEVRRYVVAASLGEQYANGLVSSLQAVYWGMNRENLFKHT